MSIKASSEAIAVPVPSASRSVGSAWSDLFKARLTTLVLLTTAVGYFFAESGTFRGWQFLNLMVGTALLAAGAAALNQYIEREHDARMQRTANRPLPSGAIEPAMALWVGVSTSVVGMLQLTFLVNALTGLLGMLTLASYVFVYTPMKRWTTLNTLVGAVPGALPPLMGWTAATGSFGAGGWALFTILFFWQIPHFMAIAWIYREDYARGGFRMLPTADQGGRRTGVAAVRHSVALLAFSLSPFALGMAGRWYAAVALLLGIIFLVGAVRFAATLGHSAARQLFFASIIYLPLTLGALLADKKSSPTRNYSLSSPDPSAIGSVQSLSNLSQ
jgi:protoheme IX farnesyltransferase